MATALLPELSNVVTASGGTQKGLTLRMRCELLRAQVEAERATFISHWQELNSFVLPRRGRFTISDVNKGDKRNQKIVDSTATSAARTLSAGMMSGITSPAREWFRLSTPNPDLADLDEVKIWLHEVQDRMEAVFRRSNLYNKLPILYGDMGVFGVAAMAVLEDDETVIRCYDFPVGSFSLGNDDKLRVRIFVRSFRLTVQQVVERWGDIDPKSGKPGFLDGKGTALSLTVQNLWTRGSRGAWIDLVHVVQPNLSYDGARIESKYKRFESMYYEVGAPNQPVNTANYGLLSHEGFDEFPILCPRWEVNSEDVYATNCPGMTALGDIKELQANRKSSAKGTAKMIDPPMTGPSTLRSSKASLLPGDITYLDVNTQTQAGFRPVHEINFAPGIEALRTDAQEIRLRIQRAFYEDLFLMLSQSDRREITAREIDERHEEKLLALGPMLEQLNQDLLDPLIERTWKIMDRKGLLPPAPDSLKGQDIQIEYVSIMAQAQKMIALSGLERTASFVGQVAQYDQTILDNIDTDELIDVYADATGIPPKIIRSKDQVAQMRERKQKALAAQQAAENAPKVASAVSSLANAPSAQGGSNVLGDLLGKARARQTLNATAQPPAPVV